MTDSDFLIEPRDSGSLFTVRAMPRARRNAIGGTREGALLVSVTAPPDDGAANAAIVALLAKSLRIAKGAVEIRRGQTSRTKMVWIALAPEELRQRFQSVE